MSFKQARRLESLESMGMKSMEVWTPEALLEQHVLKQDGGWQVASFAHCPPPFAVLAQP